MKEDPPAGMGAAGAGLHAEEPLIHGEPGSGPGGGGGGGGPATGPEGGGGGPPDIQIPDIFGYEGGDRGGAVEGLGTTGVDPGFGGGEPKVFHVGGLTYAIVVGDKVAYVTADDVIGAALAGGAPNGGGTGSPEGEPNPSGVMTVDVVVDKFGRWTVVDGGGTPIEFPDLNPWQAKLDEWWAALERAYSSWTGPATGVSQEEWVKWYLYAEALAFGSPEKIRERALDLHYFYFNVWDRVMGLAPEPASETGASGAEEGVDWGDLAWRSAPGTGSYQLWVDAEGFGGYLLATLSTVADLTLVGPAYRTGAAGVRLGATIAGKAATVVRTGWLPPAVARHLRSLILSSNLGLYDDIARLRALDWQLGVLGWSDDAARLLSGDVRLAAHYTELQSLEQIRALGLAASADGSAGAGHYFTTIMPWEVGSVTGPGITAAGRSLMSQADLSRRLWGIALDQNILKTSGFTIWNVSSLEIVENALIRRLYGPIDRSIIMAVGTGANIPPSHLVGWGSMDFFLRL